ncbi:MAG: hypothetical protein PHX68_02875 [Alphaproteobacteria bacterium]|nr:hypothetical protein [Alphaproteobacteria bacterium]
MKNIVCLMLIVCTAACGRMSPPKYPKDAAYPHPYFVKMGEDEAPPPVTDKNDAMAKPSTDDFEEQYEKI